MDGDSQRSEIDPSRRGRRMTEPTNAERSLESSANLAQPDSTTEIMRLANERKTFYQERAAALRTELAGIDEEIRQYKVAIEALQGRKITADRAAKVVAKAARGKVDPIKSARALAAWETKRRNAELKKSGK